MSEHEYYSTCFYIQLALNFSIFFSYSTYIYIYIYDHTVISYQLGDEGLDHL
jgi:hypothetical protein